MGAGLLANAVVQTPDISTDTAHSRASPLPHLNLHYSAFISSASESAPVGYPNKCHASCVSVYQTATR
ncbi:hypothetical protein DA482_24065 [Pseudomonas fluorescens]|nr:hypothetical protein D0N73_02035 [Pseudomonas fluorescens]TWR45133.1 hypothetical protein FIP59_22175 [Pseudomonas fluorescens]